MQFLGRLLRRKGVLLSPEAIATRPWTVVKLATETDDKGGRRLVLRGGEEGKFTPARLELFQVTLSSVGESDFVLRGIERVDSGSGMAAVVQELQCRLVPDLGGEGWTSPRALEFERRFETLTA